MLPLIMAGLNLLQNSKKQSAEDKQRRVAAQMGEMPSAESTSKENGLTGAVSKVAPLVSGVMGGMGTGGVSTGGAVDDALKSFDKHSGGLNEEDKEQDYSSFL